MSGKRRAALLCSLSIEAWRKPMGATAPRKVHYISLRLADCELMHVRRRMWLNGSMKVM